MGETLHRRRVTHLKQEPSMSDPGKQARAWAAALAFVVVSWVAPLRAASDGKSIVMASTTSTQDSGLFEYLLPIVKRQTGITVKVIAQGTGQALDTARRGDADVVFVHARAAGEEVVAGGYGVKRSDVMYNDFILIGPKTDPAGVVGSKDILSAFKFIKAKQAPFVSR